MGILHKVKGLAGLESKDEKPKARVGAAKKAAAKTTTDEAKPKRVAKKKAVAAPAVEEHAHDHAGHDHDHDHTETVAHQAPVAVEAAVGIGATKYILRPLITEKGTYATAHDTYMFAVLPHASKPAIKQAIEKLYGVSVIKIRTMRYDGKVVRSGRIEGRRSNFKKAYVTVAKGQSITIHKGV